MDQLKFENNNYHQSKLSINSINSINSIIEPITPPNNFKSQKIDHALGHSHTDTNLSDYQLPHDGPENLKPGMENLYTNSGNNNSNNINNTSSTSSNTSSNGEIDKDYLLSISKLPLSAIKSDILNLAKDQYGCRFLQKKIDENLITNYSIRLSNFEIIFNEINNNLFELIIDPFGNYLIQKLIKYFTNDDLNLILKRLTNNLFQISINQHGTRALQKIIENLNLNNNYQLNLLISGLKPFIIDLIKDLNGNHVIQKILNKFKPLQCQFIYDSILNNLVTVATHKHGCCVLQKCLNHVTNFQLNQFINEILNDNNFNKLINDQFGNYVLQYLISINNYNIHYKFYLNLVKFNLINYCNLKFSSNVIEKFIKNCYNNELKINNSSTFEDGISFINLKFELIYQIILNSNNLNKLINDPFGNYVIQTLIDSLVNLNINYLNLKPKNLYYLIDLNYLTTSNNLNHNNEILKFEIIKKYFSNVKIISSFGKRIHSKINLVLNNQFLNVSTGTNQSNNGSINSMSRGSISSSHTPNNSISSINSINSLNSINSINPASGINNMHNSINTFNTANGMNNTMNNNMNNNMQNANGNGNETGNGTGGSPNLSVPITNHLPSNRSNSYPQVHSRSNSLNYSMDMNSTMNNLNLNHLNYTPISTPISTPSGNYQPQFSNFQFSPQVPQTSQVPQLIPQLSNGQYNNFNFNPGLNSNSTTNSSITTGASFANGTNSSGNGPLIQINNVDPNYLKTPQIFSNAPFNDYDSKFYH